MATSNEVINGRYFIRFNSAEGKAALEKIKPVLAASGLEMYVDANTGVCVGLLGSEAPDPHAEAVAAAQRAAEETEAQERNRQAAVAAELEAAKKAASNGE